MNLVGHSAAEPVHFLQVLNRNILNKDKLGGLLVAAMTMQAPVQACINAVASLLYVEAVQT